MQKTMCLVLIAVVLMSTSGCMTVLATGKAYYADQDYVGWIISAEIVCWPVFVLDGIMALVALASRSEEEPPDSEEAEPAPAH
jgi:hypothetical protein